MIMIKIVEDKWSAKQGYINRRNQNNYETINGRLTDDQVNTIEWLCMTRHDIHSNQESYWTGSKSFSIFDEICDRLYDVGLGTIDFKSYDNVPTTDDYDYEDVEYWENRAEELNSDGKKRFFSLSGSWLWREESGAYEQCIDYLEDCNGKIEDFLRDIDDKYGTNYCPSGWARLKY